MRRLYLLAVFVLCAVLSSQPGGANASPPALAGDRTPPAQPQSPGFYSMALPQARVTALFDGLVALGRNELQGIDPAGMQTLLQQAFVPETGDGIQTAVNAYLLDIDGKQILIDTGTAQCFGPALGHVPDNLRAAGYRPQDVDAVLLTHAHPDHMCGLLDGTGQQAYPNATVWLDADDAAYWLDPEREQKADTRAMYKPLFKMARDAVAPYQADKRVHLFKPGNALPGGIAALASRGHSPGHTSYLVGKRSAQPLLVWGDIVHYHAVQFRNPDAAFEADYDRKQATAARRDLLQRAASQRWWVAGAHLPFPGLGHVLAEPDGYRWVPAELAPMPSGK